MPTTPPPVTDATTLAVQILDGLLILAAVCILVYLVLRYGLGRLHRGGRPSGTIRIVDRVELDTRRALYAVRVGTKRAFLIGSSESGIERLAELDPGDLPEGVAAQSAFARLLSRRKETTPENRAPEDD